MSQTTNRAALARAMALEAEWREPDPADEARRTLSEYTALNAVAQALLGTLELGEVLGLSVKEAAPLVGGDAAAVLLLDRESDTFQVAATTDVLSASRGRRFPLDDTLVAAVTGSGRGTLAHDLSQPGLCGDPAIAERFGRALAVPLRVRGETYGALAVLAVRERPPFTPRELDMLNRLAAFAALGIDNARHFQHEQHQVKQLTTLSALAGEMVQLRSPAELFPSAVRLVQDQFGFGHASILLLDEERHELVLEAAAPAVTTGTFTVGYRHSVDVGIVGHVLRSARAYLAQDTAADPLFYRLPGWDQAGSELVLPIRVRGRAIGVLNLESRAPYAFRESDVDVMQALADLIGVGIDNARLVEDARQAERQRLQAEKLATIGQLVAGLAHEINNPLTATQTAAELLLGGELSAETRDTVELIRSESERAALIMRELLDFSRPHDVQLRAVDVLRVIEAALGLRAYDHSVHDITVVRRFDERLPHVRADAHRLQQVFLNLIINAEQAMAGQTRPRMIEIQATTGEQGHLELRFIDSGPGIPEDKLEAIFDPFYTTKPVGQGTGLGLSVTFAIMRELGGSIRAEPREDGACFLLQLPAVQAPAPTTDNSFPARIDHDAPVADLTVSVLFVDDEEGLRRVAERYLRKRGHDVQVAENGEVALELLQSRRFDVIVTDLRMPVLGGEDLYNRLGSLRVPLQDRFLFMSGDIVSESTRRFLSGTGRPYINKPFELKQLERLIRHIAEQQRD